MVDLFKELETNSDYKTVLKVLNQMIGKGEVFVFDSDSMTVKKATAFGI